MFIIIGAIAVVACVFGGYMAMGGHLEVLWQPFEAVIICGSAFGAFLIGNQKPTIFATLKAVPGAIKGPRYNREAYMELLGLMFSLFKLAKSKGAIALETHIEKPFESPIFQKFPSFLKDHHAVEFLCDHLRLVTIGADKPHDLETVLDQEIETHHAEYHSVAAAVQSVADAMPALGIVAAVLGVIKTMGAITEPPEVLGHLIGGALVGTFLGVFLAYGFIAPLASALNGIYESEGKYYACMKAGIIGFLQGYPPVVAVEFARKALMSDVRPSFAEVEEATAAIPA